MWVIFTTDYRLTNKFTLGMLLFVIPLKETVISTKGDGEDNRPGMRGGHQMVIDVQTGE